MLLHDLQCTTTILCKLLFMDLYIRAFCLKVACVCVRVAFLKLLQDGNTALHEASRNGYAEVVHLLLKASCYADGYNYKGMNSLHLAAQQGHADVVKILLKHKANPLLANQVQINSTYHQL